MVPRTGKRSMATTSEYSDRVGVGQRRGDIKMAISIEIRDHNVGNLRTDRPSCCLPIKARASTPNDRECSSIMARGHQVAHTICVQISEGHSTWGEPDPHVDRVLVCKTQGSGPHISARRGGSAPSQERSQGEHLEQPIGDAYQASRVCRNGLGNFCCARRDQERSHGLNRSLMSRVTQPALREALRPPRDDDARLPRARRYKDSTTRLSPMLVSAASHGAGARK